MKNISYVGEKVSIGIDVHKDHYTLCIMINREIIQKITMPSDPHKLTKFLKSRFEGAHIETAYEAGFSGFVLHRVLEESGISNLVVHPGSIEVASRDRVKTDRRDSHKLADLLSCGRLRGIRIPSLRQEEARLLHRTREQLIRERTIFLNRIKMRLYQFGFEPIGRISVSKLDHVLSIPNLSVESKYCFTKYIVHWKSLNEDIKEIDKMILERGRSDELFKIYRSIPGYGPLTSTMVSLELGDMSQFCNEDSLFSYLGFTPTEHSSGNKEMKGHISRQGSPRLRGILVEAAWAAIRTDEYWRSEYHKRAFRMGGKKAIVSIARRLIGVARALAKTKSVYQKKEVKLAA